MKKRNEHGVNEASLTDSESSGVISRPGSASAIKVSWPMFRDLPGDCGKANLRSDSVKVEASVVRSVMMRDGLFYAGETGRVFQ